MADAQLCAGSVQGLLAATNLRLSILAPMLPLVYADREPAAARNLRGRLLHVLLMLCCALDSCQVPPFLRMRILTPESCLLTEVSLRRPLPVR